MNILFITANRLGDAVLSTGILGAIVNLNPKARVTVACGPHAVSLFAGIPQVVRTIVMIKQPRHRHWRALWRETIGTIWDLIVDLRNTLVSRILRHRQLKAFKGPKPRQHMVEALAALIGVPPHAASPRLWYDTASLDRVAKIIPPTTPFLALAPGANAVGKQWPAERYAELAVRLLGDGGILAGGTVAVLGAAGEEAQARPVLNAIPRGRYIDLVGRTDPREAAAWLAHAHLYVGNDSGLTHVAAATGAPTLALFGPGLPQRYRPWGRFADYLIPTDDPDRSIDLCKVDDMMALDEMKKLSVDQVAAAAEALYRRAFAA